jgi:hypothetical protein
MRTKIFAHEVDSIRRAWFSPFLEVVRRPGETVHALDDGEALCSILRLDRQRTNLRIRHRSLHWSPRLLGTIACAEIAAAGPIKERNPTNR